MIVRKKNVCGLFENVTSECLMTPGDSGTTDWLQGDSSATAAGQEKWDPALGLGFQDSVSSSEAMPPDIGLVFTGKALKSVL